MCKQLSLNYPHRVAIVYTLGMYRVEFTREAEKQLVRIAKGNRKLFDQIDDAIEGLGRDPRPDGHKSLASRTGYRIRVRGYRILYTIDDDVVLVEVFRIGPRGDVYK